MPKLGAHLIKVAPLSEWQDSAFSAVEREQLRISGPAMAGGPVAHPVEPLPGRAGVVVIDLLLPVRNVVAVGFAADGGHLATSPQTEDPSTRLSLRLEDASRLGSVMLYKTVPGNTDLAVLRAEAWTIDPDRASPPLLKPNALIADQHWEARAYGLPQDDEALVRWLIWSGIAYPTPVTWWSGTRLILHPGETLSRAVAQSGTYEPGTAVILKRLLPRGGVFLDAGANSGVFSVPASTWVGPHGSVIAVDPSPREIAKLRANLALNDAGNVIVLEEALGRTVRSGKLLMGSVSDAGLNTLGPALAHGAIAEQTCEVSVTTLDLLCDRLGLERLDVVKADIEGGELDLLLGGQKAIGRFRPAIVIEVETSVLDAGGQDVGELEALLDQLEYRTFALNGDGPPLLLDSLAGFGGGNILALPVEHSADQVRASAAAQVRAPQDRLLAKLAAISADVQVRQDRFREQSKAWEALAEAEAEKKRLKDDLRVLHETLHAERVAIGEEVRASEASRIAAKAASEAQIKEQATLLDQAEHMVHQLESRTRQQCSALADLEHEKTGLASALAAAQVQRAAADSRHKRSTVEFQVMLARHEARARAVDARMASILKTVNCRHAAALAELDTTRRRVGEDAAQERLVAQSEIVTAKRRADGLESETALLRNSLQAARSEARERMQELARLREWTEHLDRELHARELRLQAARTDPLGFLLKQIGVYRFKRWITGLFTASNKR